MNYKEEYMKYKKAFETMTDWCFDSLGTESQTQLNKELNDIFGEGHNEYVRSDFFEVNHSWLGIDGGDEE